MVGDKRPRRHYRFQRSRKSRPQTGVTKQRVRKGCINTQCRARYELIIESDATLTAIFRGYHNHDCQKGYLNHIQPVKSSDWLREQVDRKLHAGVTNSGSIKTSILEDCRDNELKDGKFRTEDEARSFYMATALTNQMIINRRRQLGLVDPFRMHQDDATSVRNMVETFKREKGDESPVVYYKARGESNKDTSEEKDSDFKQEDFLLVLQTPAQAQMMRDNPVLSMITCD